ncbi:MAG: alpha/beta fold hydrolase [Candidatus Methylomirabilia bacterium]
MKSPTSFGCEAARHRVLSVNGLELHALEWGVIGRPGLLFLHGGSAHAHWFDAVAPAFADRFHLLSLDQRGHGESRWPDPPAYDTEHFCDDLCVVLDALGWERTILVGHSMGGHNAMVFAAWHSERIAALVIVDSRPSIPAERLAALHARGVRPLRKHASAERATEHFRLLPPETVAGRALLQHLARVGIVERRGRWVYRFDPASNGARQPVDAWPLLSEITAPTLVVRGEWSPILPRRTAQEMVEQIPRARLEEVPGAYHHLMLDRPEAFVRVLDRLWSELTS